MSRKPFWLPGVAAGLAAGLALGFLIGYRAGIQPRPGLVPVAIASTEPSSQPPSSEMKVSSVSGTAPVNLNTATLEELCTLPGVGETLAGEILSYREAAGGFLQVEELMNVSGIGEKTFEELKDLVTLSPIDETSSLPAEQNPSSASVQLVDLNTATLEELCTLPGIGEVLAERIVAYREAHGPFPSVDALDHVDGIGEGTLAPIRPYLTAE